MKMCPKCRSEWPDSARFCPQDGTPMAAVEPLPETDTEDAVLAEPGDSDSPEEAAEQVSAESGDRVVAPEQDSARSADSAQASEKGATKLTPEEEEKLDQQRMQGFSETQWFMLAQDPDKLKDSASTQDLYEMQDDYDWDDDISEEERSKFSLRDKKDKKK
jgi:hypothetical protein